MLIVKFIKYSYDSIYQIESHETYGMGKESLNHSGCTEISQLETVLETITYNGKLDKHTVMNPEFEFIEYSLEELENMPGAYLVCNGWSPCGLYGCKDLENHKLHWVISK